MKKIIVLMGLVVVRNVACGGSGGGSGNEKTDQNPITGSNQSKLTPEDL